MFRRVHTLVLNISDVYSNHWCHINATTQVPQKQPQKKYIYGTATSGRDPGTTYCRR